MNIIIMSIIKEQKVTFKYEQVKILLNRIGSRRQNKCVDT